ncbi:MAG: aminotransferase class I/II-fold pyridoxal phosphate-dependent enzyme [bacterium]|nr:aminotransferase class I/II-fold pyridoxal phosphate-dependent enzyme [bacterium]
MGNLGNKVDRITRSATVGIADTVTRLRQKGHEILDFSAGRAFEPTPGYVSQAAADALAAGVTHQTMARGTMEFRKACARKLSRDNGLKADWESEFIATMGVKQALTLALLGVVNDGDEVLIEDPCFVSYQALITIAGGRSRQLPLLPENKFRWTRRQLKDAVTDRTRAILFNSPQNPTGTVHSQADLEIIAEVARERNLMIITDEVYERVSWDGREHICMATLPGMRERTITCMGLTKTFSMGGWRIGFIFAPANTIDGLERFQEHLITCASSFTQAGAAVALEEPPHAEVTDLWREWEERCETMTRGLNEIPGLSCTKPEGGFYAWVNISGTGLTSQEFAGKLLNDHQVAVVPGSAFGPSADNYIRINCVRNRDELNEGLKRIRRALT